ncbi:MAG: flagellar hook-basal body complex protein FliE [Alicyclobacillaceae bacterium]|nr:flagellar hook-basal body complex protein FliE [Alicyclobacillaceae bacterium]
MSGSVTGVVPGSVWGTAGLEGNSPAQSGGPAAPVGLSFGQMLASAMDEVNQRVNQADQLAVAYAAGGPVSVDQLMIAEQQATLAVDLAVQVRDRAVSAYQTLMNMQV